MQSSMLQLLLIRLNRICAKFPGKLSRKSPKKHTWNQTQKQKIEFTEDAWRKKWHTDEYRTFPFPVLSIYLSNNYTIITIPELHYPSSLACHMSMSHVPVICISPNRHPNSNPAFLDVSLIGFFIYRCFIIFVLLLLFHILAHNLLMFLVFYSFWLSWNLKSSKKKSAIIAYSTFMTTLE